MSNNIVYAIHNFEAENEDEINFLIGEPILVLEKDEQYLDGWWQGRNISGQTGLFPMNYTSPEKPAHIQSDYDTQELFKDDLQHDVKTSYRSSGSTVEEEIIQTISQLQMAPPPIPPPTNNLDINFNNHLNETEFNDMDNQNISIPNKPTASIGPVHWNVEQVADWLHSVGFGPISSNFIDQEITGDILLDLDIDSLKELGISTFGKRYKIMQAINSLKEASSIEIKKPTPSASVSTSAISHSIQKSPSLKRSNSQSGTDELYQFPRKAPLPPNETMNRPQFNPDLSSRSMTPQSLSSSGISRSNTYNTVSSNGTLKTSIKNPLSFDNNVAGGLYNDASSPPPPPPSSIIPPTPIPSISTSKPAQISEPHMLSISPYDEKRASTTEAFQAPEHEGWLHKQSDKYKTWNKRWFVLKGSNLFYFKSPKDVRMKGIINLKGYKIIVDESIHAGKYCFKAQHDRERTFFFYTDDEESMRVWLKMLIKTTIARDFRAPVMSSNHIATVSLDVARKMRPRPPSVIMYKNQIQKPINNDSKMTMVPEHEDTNTHHETKHRQTRESGITEYYPPSNLDIPPVPSNNGFYYSNHHEEDLIDPQQQPSASSSVSGDGLDYISWINAYLPAGKKIVDLSSGFRSGDTLILLLEGISGKEVRRPPVQKGGSMSVQMLDNIVAAFKFMGREGVDVDGQFTIKDVFGGNETKIIAMLDAIKTWADHYFPMN